MRNIVALFFLFVLGACIPMKKADNSKYINEIIPPGTVKVGINLFYDQAEDDNLSWMEYMYWIKRVFGPASAEYKATLPDSNVWLEKYPCLNLLRDQYILHKDTFKFVYPFPQIYFHHPAYRNYPIIGISQKQAETYSKWRSNRVFEYLLIRYGIIKINPTQDSNSYFTIEKYYAGLYKNYKPDSTFRYYPCYRLPTVEEWKEVTYHKPYIDKNWSKKRKAKIISKQEKSLTEIQADIIPCKNDSFFQSPTENIYSFWPNDLGIYNLRGNVSEWTSEKDICVGGGWMDCKQVIMKQDTFIQKTPSANIGFRNVCEWKEWGK